MNRLVGIAFAIGILAAVGCGDDDGDDGGGSGAVACDAFIAYSKAFDIDEDLEGGIAALQEFADAAPADVADALAPTIRQLGEDPAAVLESPDPVPGEQEAEQYVLDHCGDTTVEVVARDYAFAGVPSEIDAGQVVFSMENQTQAGEFHEALLLRQHDGMAESPLDQLNEALGETLSAAAAINAISQFDLVSVGLTEPEGPGSSDVFAANLEPGTYLLVCLLPQDTPDFLEAYFNFEEIPDQQRHSAFGMSAEFTVQ